MLFKTSTRVARFIFFNIFFPINPQTSSILSLQSLHLSLTMASLPSTTFLLAFPFVALMTSPTADARASSAESLEDRESLRFLFGTHGFDCEGEVLSDDRLEVRREMPSQYGTLYGVDAGRRTEEVRDWIGERVRRGRGGGERGK